MLLSRNIITPCLLCNVPAPTPSLCFEPGLIAHSDTWSSALTNLTKVRPAGERLAGWLGCHNFLPIMSQWKSTIFGRYSFLSRSAPYFNIWHCEISQSLETTRFVFRIVRSLWNLWQAPWQHPYTCHLENHYASNYWMRINVELYVRHKYCV